MDNLNVVLVIYACLNFIVFVIYGVDKLKAIKNKWRIPEATLLLAAVLGPVGALLGMKVWHHKTRKPKFFITVPLILIIEIVIIVKLLV